MPLMMDQPLDAKWMRGIGASLGEASVHKGSVPDGMTDRNPWFPKEQPMKEFERLLHIAFTEEGKPEFDETKKTVFPISSGAPADVMYASIKGRRERS